MIKKPKQQWNGTANSGLLPYAQPYPLAATVALLPNPLPCRLTISSYYFILTHTATHRLTPPHTTSHPQVDLVLQLADHKPVHSYYVALKSSVCCEVGGHLFFQWIAITISGMLAWLACVFARFLLARLDQLPTKNCECWC